MKEIWEWLIKELIKKRMWRPIVVGAALLGVAYLVVHKLQTDPSIDPTLKSASFLIAAAVIVSAIVIYWSRTNQIPGRPALRKTLQAAILLSAACLILSNGKRVWKDQTPFQLEIVVLGNQHVAYPDLANLLNSIPRGRFRPKLIDKSEVRLPNEPGEILSRNEMMEIMSKFATNASNWREYQATVLVVAKPLEGNLFGMGMANVAMMTTANIEELHLESSLKDYLANQIFMWAMVVGGKGYIGVPFHEQQGDRLCIFDYSKQKRVIDGHIQHPSICPEHRERLIKLYGEALVDEYIKTIQKMEWKQKNGQPHSEPKKPA